MDSKKFVSFFKEVAPDLDVDVEIEGSFEKYRVDRVIREISGDFVIVAREKSRLEKEVYKKPLFPNWVIAAICAAASSCIVTLLLTSAIHK